jgi:hypothetical protein
MVKTETSKRIPLLYSTYSTVKSIHSYLYNLQYNPRCQDNKVDSTLEHTLSDQVDNNLSYQELSNSRDNPVSNRHSNPANTTHTPPTVNRDILNKVILNSNTVDTVFNNHTTLLSNKPMSLVNRHMYPLPNSNLNKGRMNPVQ